MTTKPQHTRPGRSGTGRSRRPGHARGMPRVLYVAATNDKYELPLCVCDSSAELSRWLGIRGGLLSTLIRSKTGVARTQDGKYRYFRMDSRTGRIITGRLAPRPSSRGRRSGRR